LQALRWIAGAVGLLIALELLLQALPVSTATMSGYHHDPMVLTYPSHHRWTMSTGWDLRNAHRLAANNLGFAAERDFTPNPHAVALIGDSFVEASMLPAQQRPAARLEHHLGGGRPVYALAGPGSSVLDYAERVRLAQDRLGTRDFVLLLEAGDVRQAICGSGNVHGPCLRRGDLAPDLDRRPEPGVAKRLLRHSALAQYLFGQIKLDARRLVAATFSRTTPEGQPSVSRAGSEEADARSAAAGGDEPLVDAVAEAFVGRVRPRVQGRLTMVFDGGRNPSMDPAIMWERDRFMGRMKAAGFSVVDAAPLFVEHRRKSPVSLDVGPYDRHMNGLAVDMLMRETAHAVR
jgi:hypothetical protein